MKKIFLMSALSLAMFGVSNAQNAAATSSTTAPQKQLPQVRAKAMVANVTHACGLQGDQIGKVNQVYIDYYTKLDALGATPDAGKVKELNSAVDAQLKGTLSPSQYTLWQQASVK